MNNNFQINKKLSVLIPLYNSAEQIEKCLLSVLEHTQEDIEIIVINDGSTDNSGDIVCELSKKYPQIQYFWQENENNIYSIRKKLIEKASGRYLIFLDSDDYWGNNTLEILLSKTEEDADIILFDYIIINGSETKICSKDYENDIADKSVKGLCLQLCANNKYNSLWNKCFKKELFENNQFFRDETMNMGEDAVLSLIMLVKAKSLTWLHEPLYYYVVNGSSVSSKYKLSYCDDFDILYGYMREISSVIGAADEAREVIAKQYVRMMSLIFIFVKEQNEEYEKRLNELKNNNRYVQSYNNYKKNMPFYLRLLGGWITNGRFFLVKSVNRILRMKFAKNLFLKLAGGNR